jgi:hypothetical protein
VALGDIQPRRTASVTTDRRRMLKRLLAASALTLALTGVASVAVAQAPMPPINDSYLDSLNLNRPGTALDRVHTLTDVRDITSATVQSDILAPKPGPAEDTGCNGTSEGHTVWYDFYPDANGLVQVVTSASFDSVIAVEPYDTHTLLPINSQRKCAVNRTTNAQDLFVNVKAGRAYTIQLGGVDAQAGSLELEFNYLVATPVLHPQVTLTAQPLTGGIRVVGLTVSAPKKAHVTVECTSGCHTTSKGGGAVNFGSLGGAVLSAGADLKIFVTEKNTIGAFIDYRIERGNFAKSQRCLAPGTKHPETCPS